MIICSFIDDIYANIEKIRAFPDCRIIAEKDYIRHAKPNGYRSYHMILEYTAIMISECRKPPPER